MLRSFVNELQRTWKEAVVTGYKALSWNLLGRTGKPRKIEVWITALQGVEWKTD
jgi:hypothetical protein